jgi:hypothetical protein
VIDKRLTEEEKKKIKPANQGGGPNYLGKQETVTVPKKWLSSPDHVVAELAYITPREQKILLDANIYGSLKGKPNKGPGGIMSLQGDLGGYDASPGGPNDGGSKGDRNKTRASDIMTGRVNVSSPTGITEGYTGPSPTGRTGPDGLGDFYGQPPGFFGGLATGIKDYITGGGMLGMVGRGLSSLFGSPKSFEDKHGYATDYQGTTGPSRVREFYDDDKGGDNNQELYATTNQYTTPTPIEEEGITTLINNPNFIQRFRVKNPYRQDKQGQLDPQIMEMISRLYT